MQIHGPNAVVHGIETEKHGERVYLTLGGADLVLESVADCDRLIAAAVEAKAKLLADPRHSLGWDATAVVAQAIASGTPVITEDDEDYPPLSEAAELDELEPLPKSLACPRTNPHTAHGTCPGSAPEFDEPIEIVSDNYPAQVQP